LEIFNLLARIKNPQNNMKALLFLEVPDIIKIDKKA
jgi:hypothetical protein